MASFKLRMFSPRNTIYDGDCDSLVLPVKDGKYGIQANHIPVTGATVEGQVKVTLGGETTYFNIKNGLFHFEENEAIVISG